MSDNCEKSNDEAVIRCICGEHTMTEEEMLEYVEEADIDLEDMTGDSTAEQRETVADAEPTESPAASEDASEDSLKIAARAEWFGDGPADWEMKMTSWGGNYPGSQDDPAQYVRLRDVVEWIRGRREIMADNGRQRAQYAMLTLANELEEFTQNGGSGG